MSNRVIYHAPQEEFFNDVIMNKVASKMQEEADKYSIYPGPSEIASWRNNCGKIRDLLALSGVSGTYVTFEYMVPYSMKRIDCMIYGKGKTSENVVHIELKQWSNEGVKSSNSEGNFEVDKDDLKVEAYTGGAVRTVAHPSQQVRNYNDYLTGFIEVLSKKELDIRGYAYCYNYVRKDGAALYDPIYNNLQREYRTYSGNEVSELAEKLKEALCNGDGFSIFNKMMKSRILPSRKLLDSAAQMVSEGNASAFSLLGEQIVAKNAILDKIRRNKKAVVIVKGGPGTGKTVIALNVLAELAGSKNKQYKVHYATNSKSLLEGVKSKLPKDARLLFSSARTFIPAKFEENSLDVLLVDEAHRVERSPNTRYTPASLRTDLTQAQALMRAAKVCVFFIDDHQKIRGPEIGDVDMFRQTAESAGVKVEEVQLTSQFRCNGSDNYLDWIEDLLYNEEITHKFSKDEFDFKVYDSPRKMYDDIVIENNKEGQTARIVAGFDWPWSSKLDENGELVKDVQIGDFAMPWETHMNITKPPKDYVQWYEWAYKESGIKQVGCIYTAQGFEFDYIGVIIGPDLYLDDNGKIAVNTKAVKDPVLLRGGDIEKFVRNIYRVLMTRGMKGCFVYCCDKKLSDYLKEITQ